MSTRSTELVCAPWSDDVAERQRGPKVVLDVDRGAANVAMAAVTATIHARLLSRGLAALGPPYHHHDMWVLGPEWDADSQTGTLLSWLAMPNPCHFNSTLPSHNVYMRI
jgi:hypothetical protein